MKNDTHSNIEVELVRDDINNLKGSFMGPIGTPYEGGKYEVEIQIPAEYPFRPPKMQFKTKLWHPNVSSVTVGCQSHLIYHCLTSYCRVLSVSILSRRIGHLFSQLNPL